MSPTPSPSTGSPGFADLAHTRERVSYGTASRPSGSRLPTPSPAISAETPTSPLETREPPQQHFGHCSPLPSNPPFAQSSHTTSTFGKILHPSIIFGRPPQRSSTNEHPVLNTSTTEIIRKASHKIGSACTACVLVRGTITTHVLVWAAYRLGYRQPCYTHKSCSYELWSACGGERSAATNGSYR
jgi:hypothetical protein